MSHCRFCCISEANLRKKRRKTCPNWRRRGDLTGTRFPIDFLVISYGKWFPIASWLQGLGCGFMSFLSFSHLVGILMLLVDSVNPSLFHVFHLAVFCVAPETFIATSYLKCVWRPLNSTVFLAHTQWISYSNTSFQSFGWLVVWNILLEFPFSWECPSPNCRTPWFFWGIHTPPTR